MTDIQEAVSQALAKQRAIDDVLAAAKKEQASKIGVGSVIGAIVLGGFPIFGIIYGISLLARGITSKGWLFIGMSIAWFVLSMSLMTS